MEYNEFLNFMHSRLEEAFSPYAAVTSNKIMKNNGISLDALTFSPINSNISSNVYINDFYYEYREGREVDSILYEIKEIFKNSLNISIDIALLEDFSKAKASIAFKLINYKANEEFLSKTPHKKFLDLAIVFYISIKDKDLGNASIVIQNTHMEKWNTDTDTLYMNAFENTRRLLGCEINDMNSLIREFIISDLKNISFQYSKSGSIPDDDMITKLADNIVNDYYIDIDEHPIYVLTNDYRHLGACCVLYTDMLSDLAKQHQSDVYILPSSIHEVILIPSAKSLSIDHLRLMVREVNRTEVSKLDVLSNNVYRYSLAENRVYL